MRFPLFLILLVIFTAVLAVKRKKQTMAQEKVNEAFLERERRANATRKKDISGLDYLMFTTDELPVGLTADETLTEYENILKHLAGQKIINLSAYSNTDLKLMYGPANLNVLTTYDDNYHTLSSTLLAYARREQELGQLNAAVKILEYAMALSIDTSQIYLLLAELYRDLGTPEKIQNIRNAVSSMDESLQSLVLPELSAFHTD